MEDGFEMWKKINIEIDKGVWIVEKGKKKKGKIKDDRIVGK